MAQQIQLIQTTPGELLGEVTAMIKQLQVEVQELKRPPEADDLLTSRKPQTCLKSTFRLCGRTPAGVG